MGDDMWMQRNMLQRTLGGGGVLYLWCTTGVKCNIQCEGPEMVGAGRAGIDGSP